jgi:hypothetical protein
MTEQKREPPQAKGRPGAILVRGASKRYDFPTMFRTHLIGLSGRSTANEKCFYERTYFRCA